MDNIVPPPVAMQATPTPVTYETVLAEIVTDMIRSDSEFARSVGQHIDTIASQHTSWSNQCPSGHQYDDLPCSDFESAFMLALTWLRAGGK